MGMVRATHRATPSLRPLLFSVRCYRVWHQNYTCWLTEKRRNVTTCPSSTKHGKSAHMKRARQRLADSRTHSVTHANVRQSYRKRREEMVNNPPHPLPEGGAVSSKRGWNPVLAARVKPIREPGDFDYAGSIREAGRLPVVGVGPSFPAPLSGGWIAGNPKSDWRAYFRKAVEGNWYHLWHFR